MAELSEKTSDKRGKGEEGAGGEREIRKGSREEEESTGGICRRENRLDTDGLGAIRSRTVIHFDVLTKEFPK